MSSHDTIPFPETKSIDDRELAVLAQSGDNALALPAFEELLVRYETRIFQYILSRARNHADAEDLTQKTFLAAWNNRQKYKSRYPYGAWVFTIARNQTISHFRRKRPMPGATDFSLDFSDERCPAFQLDDQESRENLWVWIQEELGETQHSALWLTYKEDYSVKEAAAALNKSVAGHQGPSPPCPQGLCPATGRAGRRSAVPFSSAYA